jgi:hypothetical protein
MIPVNLLKRQDIGMESIDKNNKGIVDLDAQASPAILASLLGINKSSVYEARNDGKLPPNTSATYRECVNFYVNYWKLRSGGKASSMAEAALVAKIKKDTAQTEWEWLNIKQKKGELLDVKVFAELVEPVFIHMRTTFVSVTRQHPDTVDAIDKILAELQHLGEQLESMAKGELKNFVQDKMEEEIEVEVSDEPLSRFENV